MGKVQRKQKAPQVKGSGFSMNEKEKVEKKESTG